MRAGFQQGSFGMPNQLAHISGRSLAFSQLNRLSPLMNPTHVGISWRWLIEAGLRPSESPNRPTGWKSMRLRKLAQARRNSVILQTSQEAKAPLNKHSKLFQSPCHCAFPSGDLGDISQLLAHELWEAGWGNKGSNRHAQSLQSCLTPCDPMDTVGFSRQEYWSGLPFRPPGDLSGSGIVSCIAGVFFTHWATWQAQRR